MEAPKRAEDGFRRPLEGPSSPKRPKEAPGRPKRVPRRTKRAPEKPRRGSPTTYTKLTRILGPQQNSQKSVANLGFGALPKKIVVRRLRIEVQRPRIQRGRQGIQIRSSRTKVCRQFFVLSGPPAFSPPHGSVRPEIRVQTQLNSSRPQFKAKEDGANGQIVRNSEDQGAWREAPLQSCIYIYIYYDESDESTPDV